jgi:hypothetical protein
MAITIEFKNDENTNISEQESKNLVNFRKLTFEEGELKLEEGFTNGVLIYIDYYLTADENISDIISEYGNERININSVCENVGEYLVQKTDSYFMGVLEQKIASVSSASGDLVAIQHLDISTSEPIAGSTRKYIYFNELEWYEFQYANDGWLARIFSTVDVDYGPWRISDFLDMEGIDWFNMDTYYLNAYPFIPNT